MKEIRIIFLLFLLAAASTELSAQSATVEGTIRNSEGESLEFVNIAILGSSTGTTTNEAGFFSLKIPANKTHRLKISYLGYQARTFTISIPSGEVRSLNVVLEYSTSELPEVEITDQQVLKTDIIRLDPRLTTVLPGPSSGVEGLVKTLPGVSSTTELSSQYSVRGGNFDENLVYVNGIEIYRPFLVRSGQQEGLSFLNSDLVESISFSAGGFEARYGDKMSSVLDIQYKTPAEFQGSASLSLLEGSVSLEGRALDNKLGMLMGLRHKSNQYLLGTLETQGEYKPAFSDFQTLLTYDINPDTELSFLGNLSSNRYLFEPTVQKTRFGTVTDVKQLTVYFEGQEVDRFFTAMGALSLRHQAGENLSLRLTSSIFNMDESENFDIAGAYWLHRVENDFGQDNFGQPTGVPLGIGSFLEHARNYLNAIVWNVSHSGEYNHKQQSTKWGITFQHEDILDRLSEWVMIDSAGFSLPQSPDMVLLQDTLSARINLKSNRLKGYIQNTWEIKRPHGRFALTAGVRANYWDLNNQLVFSPRATILYKPLWATKWAFRASAGKYHQPPFYRELRDLSGKLNTDIKAQESLHFVLGSEYNFTAWNRPFKYTTEIYYKDLKNLIPYELDNVRIRYYAENSAEGYAAGIDFKINGEFVPGIESWASLSLMETKEKIEGMQGYIPRPTDQRLNFSLFFQDFLPKNPSYKVQLGFIFGTGVPFGPPEYNRQGDTLRMPSYRRVDIGFSKELINAQSTFKEGSPFRHIKSLWITAEVFNLLEINNTISYLWIKDVENRMFAIPNRLTSRLINIKLVGRF